MRRLWKIERLLFFYFRSMAGYKPVAIGRGEVGEPGF
jgi:hypothetical protein